MRIVKSFLIAFSMYSAIWVPQTEWKEEDMRYALCFFPWVGAVIGGCMVGWSWLCGRLQVESTAKLLIHVAIPVLVTGGFHVDGFMDTMDALHSYKSREEKLAILKDSHIGAFSVIMLILYYLIYIAAFSEIKDVRMLGIVSIGFVLSRALSGIGVVTLRPAKKGGSLRAFSDSAAKKMVLFTLLLQVILCVAGMLWLSYSAGAFALVGAAGSFVYYRYVSYKEFGGITGDTAGYFVLVCEAAIVIGAAICGAFERVI